MPAAVNWLHSLDSYTNAEYGRTITEAVVREKCVLCAKAATEFSTDVAGTEYLFSGLCEPCQQQRDGARRAM